MTEKLPTTKSPEKKLEDMTLAELEQKIAVLTEELRVLLATPDKDVLARLRIIEIPRKINEIAPYEMQRQRLLFPDPEQE
ncbi:MAG: hypothetical protein WA082_01025 [Candidatus Moraniibacteriota bacterium]